jgi:hypothetical protein
LNKYKNAVLQPQLSNGARLVAPSKFWFTDHLEVPVDGEVYWESSPVGGVAATRLGLFFVAHPDGGLLDLFVSTNLGPWTLKLTVDAYAQEPCGLYTNIDLSLDKYRLRAVSKSGTNYIIGSQTLNAQSSGIQAVFADQGGVHLGKMTNVSLNIRTPIFRAINPDVIIWAMKEDGVDITLPRLVENEAWWAQAVPNANVIYLGTPWTVKDTTNSGTADQNNLVRSIALTYNRAYVDCATPAVSYEWIAAHGYTTDGIHLNLAGSTYLANVGWNELGFFALRQPRSLSISSGAAGVKLGFRTGTNATYHLETSTNLVDWTDQFSQAGTGGLWEGAVSDPNPRVFRLRLTP